MSKLFWSLVIGGLISLYAGYVLVFGWNTHIATTFELPQINFAIGAAINFMLGMTSPLIPTSYGQNKAWGETDDKYRAGVILFARLFVIAATHLVLWLLTFI